MVINYQQLADDYARHRGVHPDVLRTLIERPSLTPASRVLEVGSGTGNYLIAVEAAVGCTAIGVEPSSAMREKAKARATICNWLEGKAESIPLPDGSVDLVFSVDVIHHVVDRDAYFAEAKRVLSPGGWLVTATDSADDIARRRPLSSHFPETVKYELQRYPSIETLESEMAVAGLREIDQTHVEREFELTAIDGYRDCAYSSLHLIPEEAFQAGVRRLERELELRPIMALSLYTLVWGRQLKNG